GSRGQARGSCGDLGGKGARESGLVDAGMAHMAVEVAVRTLRQAERPMDIDAERRSVVAVSAVQDRPPRALEARGPGATALCPSAASRVSPRSSSRRKCGRDRWAKTWDRTRNPARRAAAR